MVKVNLSDINVPELIADIWSPLNDEQREFLANHFTLQNYKKNEVIHCEGETPTHLMCLLSGKVKIYKDGVGGRSQIIRMIKPVEYFGYRPYFAKNRLCHGSICIRAVSCLPNPHDCLDDSAHTKQRPCHVLHQAIVR